ncbi:hypothetical protein [Labilithrix luteola]|uniref:hypothetical protein n=1 Tax=Labilithrix luteola TaxID=1391654 RepID=UPI0014758313|nr:hypothetical protein [Labilithrix luteola]
MQGTRKAKGIESVETTVGDRRSETITKPQPAVVMIVPSPTTATRVRVSTS